MKIYKYFNVEVSQQRNIVKRGHVNDYYWEVDFSRPGNFKNFNCIKNFLQHDLLKHLQEVWFQ